MLSLNDEEDFTGSKDASEEASEQERSSSILEESDVVVETVHCPKVDDEILNTFNSSLAYTAYLSISRLNSGVYIDSILSNADLIHQMCLQDEKRRQKANQKAAKFDNLYHFK